MDISDKPVLGYINMRSKLQNISCFTQINIPSNLTNKFDENACFMV